MKKLLSVLMLLAIISILSSCATIVGGSKYYAKVQVPNDPNAIIEYDENYQGAGEASFKALRKDANQFSVTIKKEGCEAQTKEFSQRAFRGWALAGTVIGWTVMYGAIPIPVGVFVDIATGALWKPDINEVGVTKQDFNHYIYIVNYTGCEDKSDSLTVEKEVDLSLQIDLPPR